MALNNRCLHFLFCLLQKLRSQNELSHQHTLLAGKMVEVNDFVESLAIVEVEYGLLGFLDVPNVLLPELQVKYVFLEPSWVRLWE